MCATHCACMKGREREKVSSLRLCVCVCERMCVGVNTAGSEVKGEKERKG